MYNQPGNTPSYPPNYNSYTPPQYIPQVKKKNTVLIIILVVIGILALAAGAYFGLRLLQGNTGTAGNSSDTKTSDTKVVTADEEYNQYSSLWLPYNAKVGDSWDEEGVSIKIVELGVSCDLGYTSLEDCIVLEIGYTDAGVSYIGYLAPGMGIVLMNDRDTGEKRMILLDAVPISEQEASDIVQQYSPNAMAALGN